MLKLTSNKINSKTRRITSNKKRHVMTIGSIHRKSNSHGWGTCNEGIQRENMTEVYRVGRNGEYCHLGNRSKAAARSWFWSPKDGENTQGVVGHRGKSVSIIATKGSKEGDSSWSYRSAVRTAGQNRVRITKACGNNNLQASGFWVSACLQVTTQT